MRTKCTADAFEQSAVYTSANQHEISGSNTSVSSGQQPVIMNNSPSRSVKVSSLNNAVSGTVSRPDVPAIITVLRQALQLYLKKTPALLVSMLSRKVSPILPIHSK